MRTATTPARCPDCGQAMPTPAGAAGPTSRPCPACGYVLLILAPRPKPEATAPDSGGGANGGGPRRRCNPRAVDA